MLRAAPATVTEAERAHLATRGDCGCRCRRPGRAAVCGEAGVARSMSRKGRSPDNSRTGGFFGTMKTEMSCGGGRSGVAPGELASRTGACIGRHDTERTRRSLGGMSPLHFRRSLGLAV